MRRLLITGAGKAAQACIEHLSKLNHNFTITVLRAPGGRDELACSNDAFRRLEQLGVEVRSGVCVEAIDRHARVVRGCDGSRTTFDRLVLAAGAANAAIARASGLEVRTGVVLNDFLQTSDAHVYALGEGTEHRGAVYTDPENIDRQARVLAAHLAGYVSAPFIGLPCVDSPFGDSPFGDSRTACAALPDASVRSLLRLADQTPAPEDLPALAGAA